MIKQKAFFRQPFTKTAVIRFTNFSIHGQPEALSSPAEMRHMSFQSSRARPDVKVGHEARFGQAGEQSELS